MLRIITTVGIDALLEARGIAANVRQKIMRHGEVATIGGYHDILLDRDADDLPDAVVTFLRNRAEVVYVAEWDMVNPPVILKGADPGVHIFAGWPC